MTDLFFVPPAAPFSPEDFPGSFIILPEHIPAYSEEGVYNSGLLLLSYLIAVVASYVALDIASKLGMQKSRSQNIKLICGAFAMGAGVWAMHFVGMLAYQMNMLMSYDPIITAVSMAVAVGFSCAAFMIITRWNFTYRTALYAAPFMGLAICSMHYIGMGAMQMDGVILYTPKLFIASFIIASVASAAALYLMSQARESTNPFFFKLIAALIMGVAVTGMHYTGMAASVFLPFAECRYTSEQSHIGLAVTITLITFLVVSIAYLIRQLDDAIAQVQQRTAQLFQAQKMEAVGQLTGGVAHDFNNILAVVLGNLELLERQPALSTAAYGYIKAAQSSIMKARSLTQRLLGFSRKQALHPELLNPNEALPSMLQFIERAIGANIFIRGIFKPDMPLVYVDPLQLEAALLNLALNARDAMPSGGEIQIVTDVSEIDVQMAQNLTIAPGTYVTIHVKDKGHGMTPEVIERATEPIYTTKDIDKGSGMGLSMVNGYVPQSLGALVIHSEIDAGTTITIHLPVSTQSAKTQPAVKRDLTSGEVTSGTGTILVVDDESEIRTYIQTALQELGYKVTLADSSEQALLILQNGVPDLMITDVMMPVMSGYELAEKARSITPDMGIIFMSGYVADNMMPAQTTPHNSTFLAKPFTLGKLAQAIRMVLDKKKTAE